VLPFSVSSSRSNTSLYIVREVDSHCDDDTFDSFTAATGMNVVTIPSFSPSNVIQDVVKFNKFNLHAKVEAAPQIPLYWINMDSSAARRESMEVQLRDMQWNASQRVAAVDGRRGFEGIEDLVASPIDLNKFACAKRFCSPTEVATVLSHVRAIRRAFADGSGGRGRRRFVFVLRVCPA